MCEQIKVTKDGPQFFDRDKLVCYGCCHSASMQKYPGIPSGERPCCFCIRNPQLPEKVEKFVVNCWYDSSDAVKLPMDCYHSLDMLAQFNKWMDGK